MNFSITIRILGLLLMLFSLSMVPPVFVSYWYEDGYAWVFVTSIIITLLVGSWIWYPRRFEKGDLKVRDGFLVVVFFWVVLGLFGALPFLLPEMDESHQYHMSAADAVFESVSGLTTTGATVIVGLDGMAKSLLFYRQELQWLGGMGIIVLAVAVLPMLGVGGMQLYRAETPGPVKDQKLTPRIAGTAKALWYVYFGLTVCCAVAYWVAGMDVFDAITHSFATIAIGGFSTHDASMGYFDSYAIELICVFFLVLSGVNFSLHFSVFRARRIFDYARDPEFRFYLLCLCTVTIITGLVLSISKEDFVEGFRLGLFQAVSIGTTAGFATDNFSVWPLALPVLLLFASFVGGCAGSTGGGMKAIRVLLLMKQGGREIKSLIHPNAIFNVKVGSSVVPPRVLDAVWGFFAAYVVLLFVLMLLLMTMGLDQVTAFSSVVACMNNLGPGLGSVAANYSELSDAAKWVLCFAMLLGRLEIFTLLVLFSPYFWRT